MSQNAEIEALRMALSSSPENMHLIILLVDKMKHHPSYRPEMETLIQQGLRIDGHRIELKGALVDLYFAQDKYSTCLIIAEEIQELTKLPRDTRGKIAKCYLKEDNKSEAQDIYKVILGEDPNYKDETLDEAFRISGHAANDELLDSLMFTRPDITFKDVGGMDNVKREIDLKIIKPLKNAELYAQYGKKIGGGILLYGPPGCGKTYIAKATAGEINANFINVTLNDILDMWIGQSEKNLNRYFELARESTPCVIFFDEVDALGAKRSDLKQSGGKNVINQFLAEMDGIASNNEGVLVIGATNTPWHIDPAFRRPGRFDRIIFVPPPDEQSKEAILKLKLEGKPQESIDYKSIAKKASEYSGADINAIIDIAVEAILEKAMETGVPKPITNRDLLDAIKVHKASTVEWFVTAKNYAMFANKSGLYDDILKYIKK